MSKIELYGIKIDDLSLNEAVERALAPAALPCWVVTPNAVMLDACRRDASLGRLLSCATLSLADGVGVLWAARRVGRPLRERVAGIDFGEALLREAERRELRVFLLGGRDDASERARERICARYPSLRVCGVHDGYFQKTGEEDARVTAMIQRAKPDILFVCFGFPLQERWIKAHLGDLNKVRVIAGLGGSIDVWAGKVKRAPKWLSRMGLEWAWRMAREPRRLEHLPALFRCALIGNREKRQKNGEAKR